MALSRQFVKLCDRADFDDPEVLAAIADLLPERDPRTHMERKVWEYAMLALFLRDVGRLDDVSEALATGAGDERVVFWLANHMGRVVATDIYGSGGFAEQEALASMLTDPAAHAPFRYREDRLEVRWMDARELDFEDESFDVVFSVSSMEHVGAPADVRRAAAEMGRVLRPGGHACVITECFTSLHPLNTARADNALRRLSAGRLRRRARPDRRAGIDAFTEEELLDQVVAASDLRLMQPFDPRVSAATWDNLTRLHPRGGAPTPRTGSFYPHLMMRFRLSEFTSCCLALEKPRG